MKTRTQMPKIDLSAVEEFVNVTMGDPDFYEKSVCPIVAKQGKNKGCLRASKPTIEYVPYVHPVYGKSRTPEYYSGCAAYIWRMVAFFVSPIHAHSCMPVMAFCDVPDMGNRDERKALESKLNLIADAIVAQFKLTDQPGTMRWARALGYVR